MDHNIFAQGDSRDRTAETQHRETQESSKALYSQLDSDGPATLAFTKAASAKDNSAQVGYGIIPPYMLEGLARSEGDKNGFANTYNKTVEMQN